VTAIVITPAGQRAVFQQSLPSDGRLTFRAVELPEAARLIGLKSTEDIGSEQLYLHLLAKSAPKDQFARTEDRKGFLLWQLQRGVVAAGAVGLAVCVMFAGVRWFEVSDVRSQINIQQLETRNLEQEYQRVTATFPVTLTSTENLKATVNEFRAIAARSSVPGPAFAYISRALEQFPQIELDQLVWRVAPRGTVDKAVSGPAEPVPKAPASASPASAPDVGSVQADVVQMLEISGHVNSTQRSDYRAITAQVQSFADALVTDRSYEIVRTQLPFDTTSAGTLSGDIGSSENADTPRFTVTVIRRLMR
jgi:hypothetical protein